MLRLLRNGVYTVDIESAEVFAANGKLIRPIIGDDGYHFVRLHYRKKQKTIALQRLVWMAGTDTVIPEKWEVHHWNNNRSHNWFVNLFCLHKLDHEKVHHLLEPSEVPF